MVKPFLTYVTLKFVTSMNGRVMAYPTNSPLEFFIKAKRRLDLELEELASLIKSLKDEDRLTTNIQHRFDSKVTERQALYSDIKIEPRNYDVFLNLGERAVKEFKERNPSPKSTQDCKHLTTTVCRRIFRGGSIHIVTQCLECGRPIENHKKTEVPNPESLTLFNQKLYEDAEIDLSSWLKAKDEVYYQFIMTGFDPYSPEEATASFLKKNPEPVSPESCPHEKFTLTKRAYENGSTAFVEQCNVCGKHIRCVSKSTVTKPDDVPPFNSMIEEALRSMHGKWTLAKAEVYRESHEQYRRTLRSKIREGQVTVNTTFHSYYNSDEWKRTRLRILSRDDHQCQACESPAQCVHHIVYDRLGQENDIDLISLCKNCHTEVHHRQDRMRGLLKLAPNEIHELWGVDRDDLSHYLSKK